MSATKKAARVREEYRAREGASITDAQAKLLGQEMEAMEREGVPVTPSNLIARCEAPEHPLNSLFQWDDARAAIQWRLEQARRAIASVVVVRVATGEVARAAYSVVVNDTTAQHREYVRRDVVESQDALRMQVSVELYSRIRAALREARSLGLVAEPAWERIDAAVRANEPAAVVATGGVR